MSPELDDEIHVLLCSGCLDDLGMAGYLPAPEDQGPEPIDVGLCAVCSDPERPVRRYDR